MSDVRQEAFAYLDAHQVMTLAVSEAGNVWAAAVFYVNLGPELFFLSAGHTRHARYLAANPWAAATIQEDYVAWRSIKGVQLEGPVRMLAGRERKDAMAVYGQKYPFVGRARGSVATALGAVNWYRLTATKLFFIDNSKGFGHRDEVDLRP